MTDSGESGTGHTIIPQGPHSFGDVELLSLCASSDGLYAASNEASIS